jgi:hypothetical protein
MCQTLEKNTKLKICGPCPQKSQCRKDRLKKKSSNNYRHKHKQQGTQYNWGKDKLLNHLNWTLKDEQEFDRGRAGPEG